MGGSNRLRKILSWVQIVGTSCWSRAAVDVVTSALLYLRVEPLHDPA